MEYDAAVESAWITPHDRFQNIAHRTMLGMGVGYEIIHSSKTEWEVVASPAWQSIRYDSVPAGATDRENSATAVVATRLEREINARVDFLSLYRFGVTRSSAGDYSHHFANTFSFELTDELDFDVSLVWGRIILKRKMDMLAACANPDVVDRLTRHHPKKENGRVG